MGDNRIGMIEIVKAAFELHDGFQRRMIEKGMGFVVPFPEATKLLKATALTPSAASDSGKGSPSAGASK